MEGYLGEIRMFAGNYAPKNWLLCDGQLLPIAQNTTLYSILGTIYGGNGQTNFALPDLRGRVPVHYGEGTGLSPRNEGESFGEEAVKLTAGQLPSHTHSFSSHVNNGDATTADPTDAFLANSGNNQYSAEFAGGVFGGRGVTDGTGDGLPHDNMQPSLCVGFIICVQGLFPPHS